MKIAYVVGDDDPNDPDPDLDIPFVENAAKELNIDLNNFDWEFESSNTVSELEESFYNKTGISAQVFRKSGISWLQTIVTDSWTLEQQNTRGKESTHELPKEEQEDYHEQE